MRCTKCSFISFDDLSACAKCAADLSHLSKELNGTCTETRQEFFLGSAIQTPGLDEDTFSDSQMLPPINQGDMNFDDTSTGGFPPLSPAHSEASGYDFDDTASVSAEDDIAIELGDIMPIDFDQLDSGSVLADGALEHTDSLNFDDFSFDLDKTDTVPAPTAKEIDLDLTADFAESGTDFQFNDDLSDIDAGDLSQDLPVVLADVNSTSANISTDVDDKFNEDIEFDFDNDLFEQLDDTSISLDETISLNGDIGSDATQVSILSIGDEPAAPLELDDSLVAELAGPASLDVSGEFSLDYSDDHSASGDFELDAALVAELASGDEIPAKSDEDVFSTAEGFPADTVGFENPLEFAPDSTANEALSFDQIEDLTGEFPLLRTEEDTELAGLDLADIDVSDLLDPSDKMPAADVDGSGLNQQQDWFAGQPELDSSPAVDDTIREVAGSGEDELLDIQVEDEVVLEFDGGFLGDLEIADDVKSFGSDTVELAKEIALPEGNSPQDFSSSFLDDTFQDGESADISLAEEIDLPEGNAPQDFSSSFLDDTFRNGEPADVAFVAAEDDSAEDILDEELVLDHTAEDADYLPSDIDVLALDADFEAFLNKTASGEELPEIDLIADSDDDDDDGPPDLPR